MSSDPLGYMFVFDDDPWWKRMYARLRGWPVWHQMGYIDSEE
jgi:hypothetical protein